ncbi:hypothetical protein BAY06_01000 [Elizabethkingia anophelis]|uniref:PIN domain-containing protein n=1 Tax=Elizabethkingia anophelis TaxID=1117645 RepID=UPI00099A27C5|nr:PIN domain-containing protein [Elizabethkingia anophelis]OPC55492.1 hypothetical protein BAY06_01000 [Elizabethkingia anophelis]
MDIVIDSTEFRKDRGLNKFDLSLIKGMGSEDLLTLHIPHFVYQECSTDSITQLTQDFTTIESSLLLENKGVDQTTYRKALRIRKEITKLKQNIEASNQKLWNNFVKESKAILYDFDEKDSIFVFDAYFKGNPPFKSRKKRDDIPDAFIYQTVKKISSNKMVYLVSEDANLREKSASLNNVTTFSSFSNLYLDPGFVTTRNKYDEIVKNRQHIANLESILLDNQDVFEMVINTYIDKKVNYGGWHLVEMEVPSDNGDVSIYAIDNIIIEVNKYNIQFIDNHFFIPVIVKGVASIEYAIFKSDYWQNSHRLPQPSEDLNKHYFLMEDSIPITLKKTFSIGKDYISDTEDFELEMDEFDDINFYN